MNRLRLYEDRLLITGDDLGLATTIPGHSYNKLRQHITFTKELRIYNDIISAFDQIEIDDDVIKWREAVEKARNKKMMLKKQKPKLNTKLANTLFDYQKHGVHYMSNVIKCINADDMGLGKTLQALATIDQLKASMVLVVCPNTLKLNWYAETLKWLQIEATVLGGGSKKHVDGEGIYIVNYESVWDRKTKSLKKEFECDWKVTIFDEAHRLKSRKANQTKACKKIRSERTYLLTGTPIENRPDEVWSLLNMLYPKTFNSYWRFVEQWCSMKDTYIGRGKPIQTITGCSDAKGLNDLLLPIMLRRRKEDVLNELPEKIHMNIPVELSKADRKIYDEVEADLISQLPSGEIVATPNVLTQSIRLRQIAISHKLLDTELNKLKSAKIEALMDFIEDNKDSHKIVVFTQFRAAIEVIKHRYKGRILEIHGGIKQEQRAKNIEKFQNDETCRVMLCTIQAAGTGITLTAADTVVFLDKHYNPQINKQCEDRCYRIGQKNLVRVVSIIAQNTIEQRIEQTLDNKTTMFNEVIDRK